jgi:1-acyl-sn-glycerol-3-phosphate acyltransferase
MGFAKHIAIRRKDRASQMKTLTDAIDTLKAGNLLVTFPEGTRSKDGKLSSFKKDPFTMAARAGVRLVPI